jgi:hypothetical protein
MAVRRSARNRRALRERARRLSADFRRINLQEAGSCFASRSDFLGARSNHVEHVQELFDQFDHGFCVLSGDLGARVNPPLNLVFAWVDPIVSDPARCVCAINTATTSRVGGEPDAMAHGSLSVARAAVDWRRVQ